MPSYARDWSSLANGQLGTRNWIVSAPSVIWMVGRRAKPATRYAVPRSRSSTARRSAALMADQPAISASVRPQPVQRWPAGSSWQTLVHGEGTIAGSTGGSYHSRYNARSGGPAMRVDGKVVIVTGGGRGIGRATALLLAREGARVAVLERDAATAEAVATAIASAGGEALALPCDVARRDQVERAVAAVHARFGRIDVLINNAGITADARLANLTDEAFERVLDVNLKGVFRCTQAVVPYMQAQGKGKLIAAASTVGLHGNFGQTNYAAAKGGVIAMTKTWAKELGPHGITANAVAPGFIATEMTATVPEKVLAIARGRTPLGRLGTPEDVAGAYLFLASDLADYVTGQVLVVDGGMTG